jgi:signal transduction histidine kinase/CheY-like chemotaxis protein
MAGQQGGRWLMARWAALGTAVGAALSMTLDVVGLRGPWQATALLLTLVAVLAILLVIMVTRRREAELDAAMQRAQRDQDEVSALQLEIQRRNELERELTAAKQAAESAVLAKGEFLATMSHEIRTPLNGIVPMLDLLMHASLKPDQHELVRTAFASSQQLLRIVDDILDYSKLEANRLELESTGFNLRELLEGVLQLMERPAEAKGLRLHLHIDPGVRLPVRGDPVRLRQVLTNLVSNSVKFTERGSISLHVRRIGETAGQHLIRFEVRDSGIGIAPEAQARLFHAFSQADASTTRLYGGTGLGLAICKRIVDLMGGRIGVQSTPGHGATFEFEIPLLKVHGDMPAREANLSGGRLLLLSSDQRLRGRMSMLLPNWGLRVTAVETTQEALDRLRSAARQGNPWTYATVVADLAGMRTTALALHRNILRHAMFGDVNLVYLYGDEEPPPELRQGATLLPRLAPDAELRVAITPRPAPRIPAPAAPVPATGRGDTVEPERRKLRGRILLVEDNPVNLLVAQRLLGVLGLDCDTATNGEAALLRMHDGNYDMVLIDCQMPILDGYTATRRWREHEAADPSGPRLPIIAMTANAMTGDRQRCLDAGMDDYLAKPVTRGQLESCLNRWLTGGRARTAARAVPAPLQPPGPAPETSDAPARDAATPVLDEESLDELYAVIGADAARIVAVYLEDAPQLIAQLEQAALGPDYDVLREAAHSLKSSSANVGAMALSAAAKRIELGARLQSLDRPAVAVALVVSEFERARRALQAFLAAARA